ncbi:glia maturation factor gamma isoform X1 [Scophthalmus maximus]|uniref:glia maturation factor gamma isoform X1 n=2 Tax=Scophthalmus maximus TaxID=52904 RepID=UPI001FA93730|nr:glia maturation factor gamma isoform X1 [Scophthalmus maximus]
MRDSGFVLFFVGGKHGDVRTRFKPKAGRSSVPRRSREGGELQEKHTEGGSPDSLRVAVSLLQTVSRRQRPPEDRRAKKKPLKMSSTLVVCEVDESLKAKLRKFRFRKETNNAAILMKIDMEKQLVILEEEYEDISLDELREELPERQPRFIVYSCKYAHADGRVSYPLCFIFSSPMGCKPEQQMMYAGSKNRLVQAAELTKVFETRSVDDLTEEWLKNQLAFFG